MSGRRCPLITAADKPQSRRRITGPSAAKSRQSGWRDWPPWIDRLSTWQFAAVIAGFYILCYAVVLTAVATWKRWK